MSKKAAIKIEHLADLPLDIPGAFLRIERRYWKDGTSCMHIAKWGTRASGRQSPWQPLQYVQISWKYDIANPLRAILAMVEEIW